MANVALVLVLALAGVCAATAGHCATPEPASVGLHAPRDPAACAAALSPALAELGLVCPPFAGVLLPPGAARAKEHALDDLDTERAAHARDVQALTDQRSLDAEQARADAAALEQRLAAAEAARRACETDRAPAPPRRVWYEAPGVVLVAGVVLGVGIAVGVVEAAR